VSTTAGQENGAGAAGASAAGVDGWEAAGAGAGVAAGAGVSGVCAPAIKAIAMAAPAIVCSMRFGFLDIGTIPPKICCITQNEFSQKALAKCGTLSGAISLLAWPSEPHRQNSRVEIQDEDSRFR